MSDAEITTLRLRIEGAVQGVGYRAFAAAEARRLGVDGWARNRSDGTVEAVVSGTTAKVEAFVAACARGPAAAQVRQMDLEQVELPTQKGFHLHPTL
jgi:acylphosphatase